MTYEEVYRDWEYLWNIAPANDMTGAYEDQHDLAELLKAPTKATAKRCLLQQIDYWFQTGPDNTQGQIHSQELFMSDPRVKDIYEKYCPDGWVGW